MHAESSTTTELGLPSTTVVLSTYGRRANLEWVLPPLLAQAADDYVLIVNGSRDGSTELLEDLTRDDPRVRLFFLENLGLTRAQWFGAQQARGDVVLFVDDDVLVHPGLVEGHARAHAEGPHRVVAGHMPTAPPARPGPRTFTTHLYAEEYAGVVARWERDRRCVLKDLWMGNVSFRREDYLALAAHESAPALRYHQDKHLGICALDAGLHGVFVRELHADHIHERSLEAFLDQSRRQGADRVLMHALHPGVLGPWSERSLLSGLPGPARALVRLSQVASARRPLVRLLSALVAALGAVHLYGVQLRTAKLLRRMALLEGARSVPSARETARLTAPSSAPQAQAPRPLA
ncbi:glycosyltransferase [uncultured Pseudokineococcus sp.]|uniref:glycosyltransferase family 2 protein n=1 Tax=uncultured Pseudokineococcus sp. TaxID=1642928 RepID=UPI00260C943D|nr:glycosyltransferase [uncultured Pseudokineococcus sp.]